MKSEKNTEKKSGASVLDIFIILALLMCVRRAVFSFDFQAEHGGEKRNRSSA